MFRKKTNKQKPREQSPPTNQKRSIQSIRKNNTQRDNTHSKLKNKQINMSTKTQSSHKKSAKTQRKQRLKQSPNIRILKKQSSQTNQMTKSDPIYPFKLQFKQFYEKLLNPSIESLLAIRKDPNHNRLFYEINIKREGINYIQNTHQGYKNYIYSF